MARRRFNFIKGQTSDSPLSSVALAFSSPALASLPAITAPDYVAITFDPDGSAPEIAWITDHVAGSQVATIVREKEGTTAAEWPQNTKWVHAPTKYDWEEAAWSIGDLRWSTRSDLGPNWEQVDLQEVSRTDYSELFAIVGTAFGAGDGLNTFNLPGASGRVPVVVGSGAGLTARSLGDSGGAETVVLGTPEIPAHDHGAAGTHSHTISTNGGGSHSHNISTNDSTHSHNTDSHSHFHDVGYTTDLAGGGGGRQVNNAAGGNAVASTSNESHSHNVSNSTHSHSGNTNTASNHTHTGNTNNVSDHTHASVGGGQPHQNMPPYLAVGYLHIKVRDDL